MPVAESRRICATRRSRGKNADLSGRNGHRTTTHVPSSRSCGPRDGRTIVQTAPAVNTPSANATPSHGAGGAGTTVESWARPRDTPATRARGPRPRRRASDRPRPISRPHVRRLLAEHAHRSPPGTRAADTRLSATTIAIASAVTVETIMPPTRTRPRICTGTAAPIARVQARSSRPPARAQPRKQPDSEREIAAIGRRLPMRCMISVLQNLSSASTCSVPSGEVAFDGETDVRARRRLSRGDSGSAAR